MTTQNSGALLPSPNSAVMTTQCSRIELMYLVIDLRAGVVQVVAGVSSQVAVAQHVQRDVRLLQTHTATTQQSMSHEQIGFKERYELNIRFYWYTRIHSPKNFNRTNNSHL